MNWQALTHQYATVCQISFYAAQADIELRRRENGDDEAARWFTRTNAGEQLRWTDFA